MTEEDSSLSLPPSQLKPRPILRRLLPVTRAQTRASVASSSTFSLNTSLQEGLQHNSSLVSITVKKKRTPKPEDFDQVMHKLSNVVKEKPFISDCLELKAGIVVSGFVPANTAQYFTIKLRDSEAPLSLVVKRTKGKIESYFSFTSLRPGPLMYDYRFIADHFEVFGKYSTFVEPNGCLGVLALSDARIQVSASFGQTKSQTVIVQRLKPKPRELKDVVEADLDRYRDNPILRSKLEEEVKHILLKRKTAMGQQAAEVRLFSAMSATDLCTRQALREQRHTQTRERRRELEIAKKERVLQVLNRKETWLNAVKESQRIERFLTRKQAYEQVWFSLIHFAAMTEFLYARFRLSRISRMRVRLQYIMAFRIQNIYRLRVRSTYNGSKPKLLWAYSHLLLLKSLGTHHIWPAHSHQTYLVLRESSNNSQIQHAFNDFFHIILKIQKSWRRKKNQESGYMGFLSEMWDREVNILIQRLKEKSRKKTRKTAAIAKFLNISPDLKAESLHDFFKQRKSTYISGLRMYKGAKERNPMLRKPIFNALPKNGEMRLLIKNAAESTHKLGRASVYFADTGLGGAEA